MTIGFYHTFKTSEGFYLYDVNTDKIIKIPEEVYGYLRKKDLNLEMIENGAVKKYILNLKKYGFLKDKFVEEVLHPETPYLHYLLNERANAVVLQVTQNCNFACEYCVYSGKYENRSHTSKKMSLETGKNAIDYMIRHSRDSRNLYVGFYGGEPLLEYELIKELVLYTEEKARGKKVFFNMTSNATLLTEKMIEFFSKHNMTIMISLDGPREIHNQGRKFAHSGEGTFDIVIEKIKMIKKMFPDYFKEKIHFNSVLNGENSFRCVDVYINGDEVIRESGFISTLISGKYTNEKYEVSEKFMEEKKYEIFKVFLYKLGVLEKQEISKLALNEVGNIELYRGEKTFEGRNELPTKFHHSGPCVPGALRFFVTVDGDFFPCEKVSELSKVAKIGSLSNGWNYEHIEKIMNIEKVTQEECKKCWAYTYCNICISYCDDLTEISRKKILNNCSKMKYITEEIFKDYTVLEELKNRR